MGLFECLPAVRVVLANAAPDLTGFLIVRL
jgi:hypothetical protein